jgi:hypothetical protein
MEHRQRPKRRPVKLREATVQEITVQEIVERLKVTRLTVEAWRAGTRERRPLPWHKKPKGASAYWVMIYETDLVEYLAEYLPERLKRWNETSH